METDEGTASPAGAVSAVVGSGRAGALWLAVSPCLFAGLGAAAILGIRRRHDPLVSMDELGGDHHAVLAASGVALVAICVLMYATARGRRVGAWVFATLAALPWLVGVATTRAALVAMPRIFYDYTPPGAESGLVLPQVVHALGTWLLGTVLAALLFAGAGLALAISTLRLRAPDHRRGMAVPGVVLGVGSAAVLWILDDARLSRIPLAEVAIVMCVLTLALAGAAVGRDDEGRSGARGVAAACLGILAVVALGAASHAVALRVVLGNLDGAPILTYGIGAIEQRCAEEMSMPVTATAPLALWLLVVGGWAMVRSRPSKQALRSAVLFVLVAGATIAVDRVMPHWVSNEIEWLKRADRTGLGSPE